MAQEHTACKSQELNSELPESNAVVLEWHHAAPPIRGEV